MRHRNHSKRLARKPNQARLMLKNLVTSLILYERIRTTKKRGQVLKGMVDTVITVGKKLRPELAIRRLKPMVSDENASRKILEVLKKRYAARPSGFTRVVPVGQRHGDGALLVDVILIDAVEPVVVADGAKPAPIKAAKKSA